MTETLSERELSIEEYGKRSILRSVQRQELERSIVGIEERLAQPILLEMTGGDKAALEQQLVKEREMLARGTPPHLDAAGQRRVYTKMQKCEDIIVNGLPTFTMMERGRPADIDHHVAHENARHHDEDGHYSTKRAILAWKNYRLTLDPHSIEPNFLSIASLRTDTVRGNPTLFRKNYDHIKFREYIEENLAEQFDDETYFLFCGLKVLEWAEVTICRKLDWTQKMYDAALARWQKDVIKLNPQSSNGMSQHDRGEDKNALPEPEEVERAEMAPSGKRGPHRTPGGILAKSYEPRVQIEPGWPRQELKDLDVSIQTFCREWRCSPTLFHKFARDGKWVERHLHTARATLARLQKKRRLEPAPPRVSGEPELVYDSTEPVAVTS